MDGASIFDLKTDASELSSTNQGISRMDYDQHAPHKDITGNRFASGAIRIRWQQNGQRWWIPNRSYIRCRCEFTKYDATQTGAGAQLDNADDVAPNMGVMGNLFQSADFRINGKIVSQIDSRFAEVDALETRMSKSRSWLKSIGASTNYWQDDFKVRQADVTADGEVINEVQPVTPDVVSGRVAMGFDAAGGGVAERNQWGYTAATGALVYSRGTDVAGLDAAGASLAFPVQSYIRYIGVANVPAVEMKVLTNDGAGNLVVEPLLNADVVTDGRNDFERVVKGDVVAGPSRRKGKVELVWQPPLSIFKIGHALPAGDYQLTLNPQDIASFQKLAIESSAGDKNPLADYSFHITDMFLYTATVEGPRVDNLTYLLDLDETNCQQQDAGGNGLTQQQFDVSPSSHSLTVAFQDTRVGNNTLYSHSKFKVNGSVGDELKLNRLFVQYAGESKPSPDADPSFTGFEDRTTQRYIETQMASGAYYDSGGAETIEEWQDRGAYYTLQWPRDGSDRSTRVVTHSQFSAPVANANILLFNHFKAVARITIQNGQVVDVAYSIS
jgi:hypothetical protein